MSSLFTLCWLPTMTVAHQIHYKSGHTFVFLPTPAFSVHALLSTADTQTQWMAAKLLVLIVKKSNWLKKGWPEVRNADLVRVHLRTIRTKYYACLAGHTRHTVTLCYDNPSSSSRPGVDTRAGQGWGQQTWWIALLSQDSRFPKCPKGPVSLLVWRPGDPVLAAPSPIWPDWSSSPSSAPCVWSRVYTTCSVLLGTPGHSPATATAAASLCLTCF